MNVSPDGFTVRFKTESEDLFLAEKSGAKPNTVRIIDYYERQQLKKKLPHKIIIQHQQEIFLRTITHVYVSEMILGKYLAIYSWTNENHHHTLSNETGRDPYAHTMSLDEQEPSLGVQAINVSLPLINRLDLRRGEETYDGFISKLLDDYKTPPHTHTMPQDWCFEEVDGFVSINLSKQMFNTLQNSFSGRTMNSVVQELYETYLYKFAEERGPLHD